MPVVVDFVVIEYDPVQPTVPVATVDHFPEVWRCSDTDCPFSEGVSVPVTVTLPPSLIAGVEPDRVGRTAIVSVGLVAAAIAVVAG